MPPVTRFVAFKYKPATTDEQKRRVVGDLVELYKKHADFVNHGPVGGKNNNPDGFDKGFDVVFTLEFKSEKHRDDFIPQPDHIAFKSSIMPFLEDVLLYDFVKGEYGY
ncbi:hypothetical protein K488DRAFT_85860 [Vararia minispora EC-137]|uniref:Uncharacterized protein n=1 Tax=Vararia minispora EC-137 TaxID=1314806 RepID=A0ACB8QL49_9AGAM|nr:hypothetical protein K488DRAFT_85860 [Vararia minispora EC-137]